MHVLYNVSSDEISINQFKVQHILSISTPCQCFQYWTTINSTLCIFFDEAFLICLHASIQLITTIHRLKIAITYPTAIYIYVAR